MFQWLPLHTGSSLPLSPFHASPQCKLPESCLWLFAAALLGHCVAGCSPPHAEQMWANLHCCPKVQTPFCLLNRLGNGGSPSTKYTLSGFLASPTPSIARSLGALRSCCRCLATDSALASPAPLLAPLFRSSSADGTLDPTDTNRTVMSLTC